MTAITVVGRCFLLGASLCAFLQIRLVSRILNRDLNDVLATAQDVNCTLLQNLSRSVDAFRAEAPIRAEAPKANGNVTERSKEIKEWSSINLPPLR